MYEDDQGLNLSNYLKNEGKAFLTNQVSHQQNKNEEDGALAP